MQKKQGLALTFAHDSDAAACDCFKCFPVRHVGLGFLVKLALFPMVIWRDLGKVYIFETDP